MSRHFWSFCRLVLFLSVCLPQTSHPCGHTVCAFAFWSFFFWVDWKLPEGRCKLLITLLIQMFLFSSVLICVVQRRISKRLHFLKAVWLKRVVFGKSLIWIKTCSGEPLSVPSGSESNHTSSMTPPGSAVLSYNLLRRYSCSRKTIFACCRKSIATWGGWKNSGILRNTEQLI